MTAIKVEHLSKRYRIGQGAQAQYDTLRDRITRPFQRLLNREKQGNSAAADHIWALDDISFEIGRGEVVGIIGRNGAGKSTLLKILSRITEPTKGSIDLYGRVGSLLEVGTGFHPELTGRENIFLNGAILGMKRMEITRKFDEIVAFAEIEKFIDTPVKFYSSGMYVRLAFAVAAHLEPEILLVDEVLAVGDVAFQKKCLGKMSSVAEAGRTVLFVSHDMTNISVLCDTALLLDDGKIQMAGPAKQVIEEYITQNKDDRASVTWTIAEAPGNNDVKLTGIEIKKPSAVDGAAFKISEPVEFTLDFAILDGAPGYRLNPVITVKNSFGLMVFSTSNYHLPDWGTKKYPPGKYRATCQLPGHILNDGQYAVDALLVRDSREVVAAAEEKVRFSIYDAGELRGDYVGSWDGVVRPNCIWHGEEVKDG